MVGIFESIATFQLAVLILIPGITSILTYNLLNPRKVEWASLPLEAIFYGFLNYVLWGWTEKWDCYLVPIFYFFVAPSLLSCLFLWLRGRKVVKKYIHESSSSSWDYFFAQKEDCLVVATLKNGEKVGGYFGGKSHASAFPNNDQLYIQWTYLIDEDGNMGDVIEQTKGVLINKDEYSYLEFYEIVRR